MGMSKAYNEITFGDAILHYSKFGSGDKVLLCFHGFGLSLDDFYPIEETLKNEYTFYNFDLFFHGKSFWPREERLLDKRTWKEIINYFLNKEDIHSSFSLLGFSMGGKFALATLEAFSKRIDKIILMAPDGIKTSFWYSFATYPGWTRNLFKAFIDRPKLYYSLIKYFHFFRVLDKGILRFAQSQMRTKVQREQVYFSWVVFRELKFDMEKIAQIINKNKILLELFLGKHDKIITEKNMQRLLKKLDKFELHVLNSGHSNLIHAVADYYKINK